jgi:hypothetical protein
LAHIAVTPAVVGIAAFILLALRRPTSVYDPEFVFEDGREFFMGAWRDGPLSVVHPYAGYLHLTPRLVALLERTVPIQLAPLVGMLLSLAIVAAIAAYLSSDALANVVPDKRVRLALAAIFVLMPNAHMSLGSPTFIQFYLGVFLVAAAVARRVGPTGRLSLFVASSTGPFGVLFLPLFAARAWLVRDRDSVARLLAVGVPACAQIVVLATSARSSYVPPPTLDPNGIALVLGGHLLTAMIGGIPMVHALRLSPSLAVSGAAAIAVAGLIVVAARRLNRGELLVLGYAAAAVIGVAFLFGTDERSLFINPLSAGRYFLIPGAMLYALIVIATARGSRPGLLLAAVLATAVLGDFRLNEQSNHDWWAESQCIGGPVRCVVPIYPDGIWDIVWEPPAAGSGT